MASLFSPIAIFIFIIFSYGRTLKFLKVKCNPTNKKNKLSPYLNHFYSIGVGIGKRPWVPILLAFVIVGGCGGGFYFFKEETAPENLWVPDNSQAADDKKWVDERFPGRLRFSNYIAVANNVLTPEFLKLVGFLLLHDLNIYT